jgi:hypothetical protein
MDYTRLTQNGAYEGWIEVSGARIEVRSDRFVGTRDRSWGVRPVGAADSQPLAPPQAPQFYWLWAPLNFDDCIVLYDVSADEHGNPWHTNGVIAGVGEVEPESLASAESTVVFKSGTRHARSATLRFRRKSGATIEVRLEPRYPFYMSGLGYMNPEWGHGLYKGEQVEGYDSYDLGALDEAAPIHLHVQAVCGALMLEGGREKRGVGVLEQLILGPHRPSGFRELFDTAP